MDHIFEISVRVSSVVRHYFREIKDCTFLATLILGKIQVEVISVVVIMSGLIISARYKSVFYTVDPPRCWALGGAGWAAAGPGWAGLGSGGWAGLAGSGSGLARTGALGWLVLGAGP